MSDATSPRAESLRSVDRSILEFLAAERAEYAAIIANRIGVHTPYVERRCRALAESGYVEPVSGEVVYRVTEAGLAALSETPSSAPET